MTEKPTEPTAEMAAFYECRTNEHIERVRKCLLLLAEVTDYGDKTVGRRVAFSDEKRCFIYEMIDLLDRRIAENQQEE